MDNELQQRMQVINEMLLEMASGNFFYRIERSIKNDNIEALVVTLNMLAEEIQDTIIHQGYANTNETILDIVQMSFLLDKNGCIRMVNQNTCNILSRLYDDIVGISFKSLLSKSSIKKWKSKWKKIKEKEIFDTSLNLKFKSKSDLIIPKIAYVTTFDYNNEKDRWTLITVIHHSNFQNQLDSDLKNRVITKSIKNEEIHSDSTKKTAKPKLRLSFEDIRKIRDGHDIIINNLEKDLPALRDFALQIGTNEFKLKYGFKELYGTTVHRFLMQERLRKAQMMIQYSDVSLKSIAYMVGFKSMPHFSRSFKKRYGYSPSALRKNAISTNEEI